MPKVAKPIWFYGEHAKWIGKSVTFAMKVSGRLVTTEYAYRLATHKDLPEDVVAITMGRLAEVALCLFLGLNPDDALDWQTKETETKDLVGFGWCRIDNKCSKMLLLMYPVEKRKHLLDLQKFDVLVATYGNEFYYEGKPLIVLFGWVTWERFCREHKVAPQKGTDPKHRRVETNTPYMELSELEDMSTLVDYMKERAPAPTKAQWLGGDPRYCAKAWVAEAKAYGFPLTEVIWADMKKRGVV